MTAKVQLLPRKKRYSLWKPEHHEEIQLTQALPFFLGAFGRYVHRPRSATLYCRHGEAKHIAVSYWCGGTGFKDGKDKDGSFLAEPPIGSTLCATCEGRAIGAGQQGSHMICGRIVKFSPR